MILTRSSKRIEHGVFKDILRYLRPGDLLVINNTRVLPARLIGKKISGGKCELLFIPSWNGGAKGDWDVLIKGTAKLRPGVRIQFDGDIAGELVDVQNGKGRFRFFDQAEAGNLLRRIGHIPLPPYIKREDEPLDRDRYQTIFAERDGAIAAPTAGLHFTPSLVEAIRDHGVEIASITLHTGIATFAPVKAGEVEDHAMGAEWVEVPPETSRAIEETRGRAGRVFSVGTTTTRALESFSDLEGKVKSGKGLSSLFIYPPYRFRVVDGLITNFHLPKSTLMMLVSAFAGRDFLMESYGEAVEKEYRFYSYGDAMLIL
jgi:S-adenosylmethionine:tRNA ribosyltransferase-isomerase